MTEHTILVGDWIEQLRTLPDQSIDCIVTSPPYWQLRDYDCEGQLGLEPTFEEFLAKIVAGFAECYRVLRNDGSLYLNMGDSYSQGNRGDSEKNGNFMGKNTADARCLGVKKSPGFRPKNLIGQPWRVAIALQEWGWYLREDIIWHKPAPMPESCVDRCTKAHEYIFHLTKPDKCLIFRSRDTNEFIFERKLTKEEKAQKVETASGHLMPRWMVLDYYYNQDAIREPVTGGTHARIAQNLLGQTGSGRANGNTRQDRPMKAVVKKRIAGWDYGPGKHRSVDHAKASSGETKFRLGKPASSTLEGSYQGRHDGVTSPDQRTPKLDLADPETDRSSAGERMGRGEGWRNKYNESFAEATSGEIVDNRNARSVWTIPSRGYAGAHFATFPEELAYKCLLVGCRPGGVVCDPFGGSGTTAEMAKKLNLNSIMIDINPNNVPLMQERLNSQQDPLF